MITLAETLIIPDIAKTEFNCCFIIHCFMENIQKLLLQCKQILIGLVKIQGQTYQAAASLETIQVLALFSQRCAMRTAHGIICRYNWIADYTIIMLVHRIK